MPVQTVYRRHYYSALRGLDFGSYNPEAGSIPAVVLDQVQKDKEDGKSKSDTKTKEVNDSQLRSDAKNNKNDLKVEEVGAVDKLESDNKYTTKKSLQDPQVVKETLASEKVQPSDKEVAAVQGKVEVEEKEEEKKDGLQQQ